MSLENWTKCTIESHYYKIDLGNDCKDDRIFAVGSDSIPPDPRDHLDRMGVTYYVKCVRCGNRILINDKTYHDREAGVYKL